MFEQIIAEAVKEGLWALLFVFLLLYVMAGKECMKEQRFQKAE